MSDTLLVIGATGLLGPALIEAGQARGADVLGAARRGADVKLDLEDHAAIDAVLNRLRPRVVINAAALTQIDTCEADPDRAFRVNADAVRLLVQGCRAWGASLVQISTDHFFVGDGAKAHDETDNVELVNEYAKTKFAGERFALELPGALVVRTNIVGLRRRDGHTPFGTWAIDAIINREPLTLFDDVFFSPLHVRVLANAVYDLLVAGAEGVVNVVGRGAISKAAFIQRLAMGLGVELDWVEHGSVAELATRRADSLVLDAARAERLLAYPLPQSHEAADALLCEYRAEQAAA